jgi:CheY-like chemotaxis protein
MAIPEKPFVLLVDDNEPTCTLVTALLRKDFTVDCANDGFEAIDKLRTKTFSAIILDLLMPQLDGFGVLDHLKTHNPQMLRRVLVVTAALTKSDKARVNEYDVCAVLGKPFEVESLLSAVRQCVADDERLPPRGSLLSSGVILLLADILKQRFL